MKPAHAMIVMMLLVVMTGGCSAPTPGLANAPVIYDPDPQHLWNRLHAALLCRVGPDGKTYGVDPVSYTHLTLPTIA